MVEHSTGIHVTSVKMGDDVKARLDRLRADLSLLHGRAITAQDLLAALVRCGERDRDALLSEFSGISLPLPSDSVAAILAVAQDIGPTSPEDIDRTLYGGESRRRY